jgi:dolichyl-phosphate beta-glucosyltransferase
MRHRFDTLLRRRPLPAAAWTTVAPGAEPQVLAAERIPDGAARAGEAARKLKGRVVSTPIPRRSSVAASADRAWVVIPCFNEERRLNGRAYQAYLFSARGPCLLFVDDGSTDGTRALLDALAAAHPHRARVLGLPANRGKAEAVRQGLRAALCEEPRFVGYWDADLATPLAQIELFLALLAERTDAEVVMGSRVRLLGRRIERYGLRHLVGRLYATLASVVLALPVYDTQCGAKVFRASRELRRALDRPFRSRWAFDVELIQRLQLGWGDRGFDRIVEVPLPEWRDVGESKVSLLRGGAAFAVLLGLLARSGRSLPAGGVRQAAVGEEVSLPEFRPGSPDARTARPVQPT